MVLAASSRRAFRSRESGRRPPLAARIGLPGLIFADRAATIRNSRLVQGGGPSADRAHVAIRRPPRRRRAASCRPCCSCPPLETPISVERSGRARPFNARVAHITTRISRSWPRAAASRAAAGPVPGHPFHAPRAAASPVAGRRPRPRPLDDGESAPPANITAEKRDSVFRAAMRQDAGFGSPPRVRHPLLVPRSEQSCASTAARRGAAIGGKSCPGDPRLADAGPAMPSRPRPGQVGRGWHCFHPLVRGFERGVQQRKRRPDRFHARQRPRRDDSIRAAPGQRAARVRPGLNRALTLSD